MDSYTTYNPQRNITVVLAGASLDCRFFFAEPWATEYCLDAPPFIPDGNGNTFWIPRESN